MVQSHVSKYPLFFSFFSFFFFIKETVMYTIFRKEVAATRVLSRGKVDRRWERSNPKALHRIACTGKTLSLSARVIHCKVNKGSFWGGRQRNLVPDVVNKFLTFQYPEIWIYITYAIRVIPSYIMPSVRDWSQLYPRVWMHIRVFAK